MSKFTSVHVSWAGTLRRTLLTTGVAALLTGGLSLPTTIADAASAQPSVSNIPSTPVYGGTFTPSVTTVTSGTPSVASLTEGSCSVDPSTGTVAFLSAGPCILEAHQATNGSDVALDGAPQFFTIGPATLTVTASSVSMAAGTTPPTITPLYAGFVGADSPSSLSVAPTCHTTVLASSPSGAYPSYCAGGQSTNYNFAYVVGSVSVGLAPASVPHIANLPTADTFGNTYTPTIATNADGVAGVVSLTPSVCSVQGTDTVVYVSTGTCTLQAQVAEGNQFAASEGPEQSFQVEQPSSIIPMTYNVTNSWVGGYQAAISLNNTTPVNFGTPSSPWSFSFVLPTGTAIDSFWGAKEVSTSTSGGTLVTVTAPSYEMVLTPGTNYSIGFTTKGNGGIQDCRMGGSICSMPPLSEPGAPLPPVGYAVLNLSSSGYQGQYLLSNNTKTTIGSPAHPWTLSFVLPTGTSLIRLWGGDVTTSAVDGGTEITVTGAASSPVLAPGATVTIGFTTNGVAAPTNCTLNAVVCPAAPSPASNVKAALVGGVAVVSWTPPTSSGSSPISSYVVSTSGSTKTCTVIGAATVNPTCTFRGLDAGISYSFQVSALNGEQLSSGPSLPSNSVTPIGAPTAPIGVTVNLDHGSAVVTWSAPSLMGGSTLTGYTVSSTPALAAPRDCVDTMRTTCTFSGLTYGASYTFSVVATNAAGFASATSAPSNAVVAQTNPAAPTNVRATPSDGKVVVSWTQPTFTGGSPLTGFTVTSDIGLNCWAPVASGPTDSCTYRGLTNGVAMVFVVRASNKAGLLSNYSTRSASVKPFRAPTAPLAPQGLVSTAGNGQVALHWDKPRSNGGQPILGYSVAVSPAASVPPSCVATKSMECVVTGLDNSVKYVFRVVATNAIGTSRPATTVAAPVAGALRFHFDTSHASSDGYRGHYRVSNLMSEPIGSQDVPWNFRFTLPAGTTLASLWGAQHTISVRGGVTTVIVTPVMQRSTLLAGGHADVYFTTYGQGIPSRCESYGEACSS